MIPTRIQSILIQFIHGTTRTTTKSHQSNQQSTTVSFLSLFSLSSRGIASATADADSGDNKASTTTITLVETAQQQNNHIIMVVMDKQ